MDIMDKVKAFKRLNNIQDISKEKKILEDLLFTAWRERGILSHEERVEVMEKVVKRIKKHGADRVRERQKQLIEEENALDRAKMLNLFGAI